MTSGSLIYDALNFTIPTNPPIVGGSPAPTDSNSGNKMFMVASPVGIFTICAWLGKGFLKKLLKMLYTMVKKWWAARRSRLRTAVADEENVALPALPTITVPHLAYITGDRPQNYSRRYELRRHVGAFDHRGDTRGFMPQGQTGQHNVGNGDGRDGFLGNVGAVARDIAGAEEDIGNAEEDISDITDGNAQNMIQMMNSE